MIERLLRLRTLDLIDDRNIPELSIHNKRPGNAASSDTRPLQRDLFGAANSEAQTPPIRRTLSL